MVLFPILRELSVLKYRRELVFKFLNEDAAKFSDQSNGDKSKTGFLEWRSFASGLHGRHLPRSFWLASLGPIDFGLP